MFISDPSELSILLKRQKKKVEFNNEVIRKHKKKFEDVRCKVNNLLQQCSKNEPCYNLVKTVNTGKTIHLTETSYKSTKESETVNKSVCLTPKKSRKKQLSCTSEAEINTNNVSPNYTISNRILPQVLSKKSKKLIGTLSNSSVKNSNSVGITDSSSSEDEPTKKKSGKKQLSCISEAEINTNNVSPNSTISNGRLPRVLSKKSKKRIGTRSNSSVKNASSVGITDSSSSEDEPVKKKSKLKPRRQTKKRAKDGTRYLTEGQQKKLAKSLKRNEEIRNLPQFDAIHRFLRGKEGFKVKGKTARPNVPVPFWNTYMYLIQEIERCISRNDWNNLTRLLIALADGPKKYQSFLLKASLINLLCNPAAQENDLTQFLQECFSCHSEDDMNTVLTTLFHITNDSENEKINNNNLDATFDSEISIMDIE